MIAGNRGKIGIANMQATLFEFLELIIADGAIHGTKQCVISTVNAEIATDEHGICDA